MDTKDKLADFIQQLSREFPEVSFAKLSRIVVRTYKFIQKEDVHNIWKKEASQKGS